MGECLAGKHDQGGTFSQDFPLILINFKSDDGETWQEHLMGRNLFKLSKSFDDAIFNLIS